MLMRTNQVFDPSYKEAIKRAYSKPQIALTASNVGYLIRIWTKIVYMHINACQNNLYPKSYSQLYFSRIRLKTFLTQNLTLDGF